MATTSRAAPGATGRWITRPRPDADTTATTSHRTVGLLLALAGMILVLIAAIGSWVAAGDLATGRDITSTLAWTFAITTTGFGLAKIGIAITLVGIVTALWHRVNSVAWSLPRLRGTTDPDSPVVLGDLKTSFGAARATQEAPGPLFVHRMARFMWLPVTVMGAMALAVGLIIGLFAAGADSTTTTFRALSAWTQGTMFLGEGLLLSGISLLLGTILAGLRHGGGEVQRQLRVGVHTLRMPMSAKAFLVLMATGMMMAIAQFVLYVIAAAQAADAADFAVWSAWLGPFRETALGVLLAGIVLALFTIAKVLGFQFDRIRQLLTPTA